MRVMTRPCTAYIKHARNRLQPFRERLSGKVHATILNGIAGGFEFSVFQRNLKELARKAMEMCLRVLKESNKSRFDSYSVRNSVLIISHITFRDCRVHIFSDNLSRNRLYTALVLCKNLMGLLVCTWRHGGHVGVKNKSISFLWEKKNSIVLKTWPPCHVVANQEFWRCSNM